jgi:N utilization substance protein B
MRFNSANAARALARRLAMQAIYRWLLNTGPWQDLITEFAADDDMRRADRDYFARLVQQVCEQRATLETQLQSWIDRQSAAVDPVERSVLLIALIELGSHPDVPFRVVISEAVSLAKRFGATDGHKFVNAVLDRAARVLRPNEH